MYSSIKIIAYVFCALCSSFLALPSFAAPSAEFQQAVKQGEVNLQVKAQLDSFAREHITRANATMAPGRATPAVSKFQKEYIAKFREIEMDSVTTEIHASNTPGCQFVGHIVYLENEYECISDSKATALKGEYKKVRARRIRELFRYNQGKWIN